MAAFATSKDKCRQRCREDLHFISVVLHRVRVCWERLNFRAQGGPRFVCHDVLVTPSEVQFVLSVHLKAARTSIVHPLSGHESGFARNKLKIGVVMALGCPK